MVEITAALVKELRGTTGAGMMDCKKALTECEGDMERAVDWLRTKGLAAAAKKAGRVAAEGLVGIAVEGNSGAVVEVNSETDFVARNESFQSFVASVAKLAVASGGDMDKLKAATYPGSGRTVADELTQAIATIGENMDLRRIGHVTVGTGVIASYVHSAQAPGLGKIGVLVALESKGDRKPLAEFGKLLAMHVAAANPQAVRIEDISAADLDRERNIIREQARESGKPDNIIEKMLEGRIRKYYEDVVLTEQTYVIDGESKVRKVLDETAVAVGAPIEVTGFVRFKLGEGVDKKVADFAAEVAAQTAR